MGAHRPSKMHRHSRDFRHCAYINSGAYSNTTPESLHLKPNKVEMEYDKARIELEGPKSKKWPGASWVEEDETDRRLTRTYRPTPAGRPY